MVKKTFNVEWSRHTEDYTLDTAHQRNTICNNEGAKEYNTGGGGS